MGISQVPEGRQIFAHLRVIDNMRLGGYLFQRKRYRADNIRLLEQIYNIFPILKDRANQISGTLSGGEQQMLAIARALMARPQLLLLDEPSFGLAPLVVDQIFHVIITLNGEGKTILLVEQNAQESLQIAHFGYVMEMGRVITEGPSASILKDEVVSKAYLGR